MCFKLLYAIIKKQTGKGYADEFIRTVNDVLVKLFNEIMDVEERALLTSEYKDISVNDMHVIEAIGIREPKNMSTVHVRYL